ncbi:flagellar hook-basal body complex protein [Arcobacter porcinus]|uniref:Flagellar hook protein FlgE n=1 Tax=Arcobacter porcinus TaxID=1935204 RepID=A0A5C2HFV0_9BACT|nr:flagellar hook-basal body complex protein [Arcobacter porcinus]OCL89544.1 Flagellar hook protein FlgE [Aliarcobacter thereius]QEP40002.1 flagellar hook protein, epsilonproteobacterial variant [Arcobacter porcinus]
MIGALWTGISGLSAHQTALDNESNNIANVNTIGYKASRISFADQIYQGKIGKGSYVQDAEKVFVTGGSKITGVEYDVALQGDGFFTVINKNTLGTAETFYTRAGNLRMGQSGTLQNADGYEVQGWAMSSIDQKNDVKTTNQNASRFTDVYVKNLGNGIIRHKDYIETIAAKATNYNETAKSDPVSVFSGAGGKTKAAKLKDIDLALSNYNEWLQKYKDDPSLPSKGSTSQVSQANFKTGVPPTSIIGKEGDSIEMVVNGNSYTQKFVVTKTTPAWRDELWDALPMTPVDERALYNLKDPALIEIMPTSTEAERSLKDQEIAKYDKLAGKINTYKALADTISNKEAGVVAYMAKDRTNPTSDVLNPNGMYEQTTNLADMLRGVIQIKSLVPGKEFKITQVAEYSGENEKFSVKGTFQSTAVASLGSGKQALEEARDALSRLVNGNQRSVYTTQDLYGAANNKTFSFSINVFDKDLGYVIPVPNDGAVPPKAVPIEIGNVNTGDINTIVDAINNTRTSSGPQLGDYIVAKNINGNLVLETNEANYDIEFDAKLETDPTVDLNELVNNAGYTYDIKVGSNTISTTFATTTPVDKNAIYTAISTNVSAYNAANPGRELVVSPINNGVFTISSADGERIEGDLRINVAPTQPNLANNVNNAGTSTVMEQGVYTITAPVTDNTTYGVTINGTTYSFTTGTGYTGTESDVRNNILAQIKNDPALKDIVNATANGTGGISINQTRVVDSSNTATSLNITQTGGAYNQTQAYNAGNPEVQVFTVDFTGASRSEIILTLAGSNISIKTEENETPATAATKLQDEINKNPNLRNRYEVVVNGADIEVREKAGVTGYTGFGGNVPSITFKDLEVPVWDLKEGFIEVNSEYSGRRGAGGEFMEITTRVDQSSTQASLQLRLDVLNISDSKFGAFKVDDTGLVTITEGGVEYAVGQVSIARFTNNRGLEAVGNNNFRATQDSGNVIYSTNNNNTNGVKGQALELSKADLSESLVNLMVFQRAFEANAKSITTSDELLSTLINLKR